MTVLPPAQLPPGTYSQRVALDTSALIPGTVIYQIDTNDATTPPGYYYWTGSSWVYDPTQASGGADYDGRGTNTGTGGSVRVNNGDNNTTLIASNPTGVSAFIGLWNRLVGTGYVIGLFISQAFESSLRTLDNQVLGLWSTNPTNGASTRMLDLKRNTSNSNKIEAGLRYGNANQYGQIPVTPSDAVNLTDGAVVAPSSSVTQWTIPANGLINGTGIEFFMGGPTAANANGKRAQLAVAGVTVADTTSIAANNKPWMIRGKIYWVSATTFKYLFEAFFGGNVPQTSEGTGTIGGALDWTSTQTVALTLTGTSNGDITVKEFDAMVFN